MRVLLIAEAANPEWVSVPLEGWSHARAIAGLCDSHLVTQIRNRDAIVRAGLEEGKDFTAIDSEKSAAAIWKISSLLTGGKGTGWTTVTALSALTYYHFERLVWQQFRVQILSGEFDLVHRITPLSPTTPSLLAKKCRNARVPFVMGPLNGGVPWPKEFDKTRRQEREWLSYIRGMYKLLPGYNATRANASALIVGSQHTKQQMAKRFQNKCVYIPENAIASERFTARRTRTATSPLKAAFVGRLVPYKGADMLLEAAAPLIRQGKLTIDLIGDGPQRAGLQAIIDGEKLSQGVQMAGWVKHEDLQHRLAEADLFTFPSIREFGGAVVLEAMAVGLVPVVVDYGGPAELVTDRCGFKVALGSRSQIVQRFRERLEFLCENPHEVDQRSPAALKRAHENFTWDAKARQVMRVYQWVCAARKPLADVARPDFDRRPEFSLTEPLA